MVVNVNLPGHFIFCVLCVTEFGLKKCYVTLQKYLFNFYWVMEVNSIVIY